MVSWNVGNKLWSSSKFDDDNIDDEADYGYLCGGNNDCREIINLLTTILCSCKPTCKPDFIKSLILVSISGSSSVGYLNFEEIECN